MVLTGILHAGGHFKFTTLFFFPMEHNNCFLFLKKSLWFCYNLPVSASLCLTYDKCEFVELEMKNKESVKFSTKDGCSRVELYREV